MLERSRILVSILAVLAMASASQLFADTAPAGKELFLGAGCDACHSVEVAAIPLTDPEALVVEEGDFAPPDLSGVGTRHDATFIDKFLLKEEKLHERKHMKRFKGSDEERAALVAWLMGLEAAK